MNRHIIRKLGVIMLLSFQITLLVTETVSAITLDGIVDDVEWAFWFTDNGTPEYSIYHYEDDSKVYLGVIAASTIPDSAQLEIAFKGADYDLIILYSDISGIYYKRSKTYPGLNEYYWRSSKIGLPEGVEVVHSVTGSYYSYEIAISKDLLGKYGEEYPDKFELWLAYTGDGNGKWIWSILDLDGEVNFYPDDRPGWWFSYDPNENSGKPSEMDEIPMFHAPEIPLGTIMSLATMLLAVYLKIKETPKLKLS